MKWKKVTPELNRFLEDNMAGFPVEKRAMFGASTFFLNGNMFAGIHEDNIILRLSDSDRKAIAAEFDEIGPFEPMPGRPMKEYMAVPESVYTRPGVLRRWLEKSYDYAGSLPVKTKTRAKK